MTAGAPTPLEATSALLGVAVAHADLDDATPTSLAALDDAARAAGTTCVLGELNPERSHAVVLVQEHGHRLAEVELTLRRRATSAARPRPAPPGVEVDVAGAAGVGEVDALLDPLVRWRGVAHEPRLGPAVARRLVELEVADAAAGVDGSRLLVARRGGEVVGCAVVVDGPVPRVALLSVATPGDGTSDALVGAALAGAGDGDLDAGPMAAGDLHGQRCVERMGFLVSSSRYRYHRWLDGDGGATP